MAVVFLVMLKPEPHVELNCLSGASLVVLRFKDLSGGASFERLRGIDMVAYLTTLAWPSYGVGGAFSSALLEPLDLSLIHI